MNAKRSVSGCSFSALLTGMADARQGQLTGQLRPCQPEPFPLLLHPL